MTPRSLRVQALFVGVALLSGSSAAAPQAHARAAAASTGVASAHPAAELAALQQAQAQALASGNSAAIASTSRLLAAGLFNHLATLARETGDTTSAAELESKARLLDETTGNPAPSSPRPNVMKAARPPSAAQRRSIESQAAPLKKLLAQGLNDLGTAEARQGNFAAAESHFDEATQWDAPSPTLLRNLGTAAFRVSDFPTAIRAFAQYLQPPPTPPDPRSQLLYALSLFSSGNFPAAAQAFSPVADETMRDPRSAYSWAFSLSHAGDPNRANTIATALSSQGLPPDELSLVCHIFVDTESFGQSVACYRKVLAADPSFRLAHYQIAESLIRMDRPTEAIGDLRQEMTLSPDDPNVQYSMAFALLQTSDKDGAFHLLRSITAAHPEMAQPQYQFGKLLLERGETADAITHLQLAEAADPSLDYVHYQLQAAYRKSGRTADADREARLFREIKAHHRDLSTSKEKTE